ncbi:MAG: hypothetical protein M5U09_22760 [Gammaproteobacteria bacterium]|nr:hypothetical protein [Gammaproteobacteria bacterium]
MSEESIILQVLAELRHAVDRTVAGLGEVRADQKAQGATLERVLVQTTQTNGRVGSLEERVELIERREIREDGIEDGKAAKSAEYRSRLTRAWSLIWSPMGKGAGALGLLLAGWTLHQVWPW